LQGMRQYLDLLRDAFDKSIAIGTVSICCDNNIITYIPYLGGISSVDPVLSIGQSSIACNDRKVLSRNRCPSSAAIPRSIDRGTRYLAQSLRSGYMDRSDVELGRLWDMLLRRPSP
jgi:hypothetical protein